MRLVLLLFVIIPLLEIFLLIKVGSQIGALTTIALLVAAAVLGVAILRLQGMLTLMQARESMARGVAPAAALGNGVLLALAGVLLIIPGFASDLVAFVLLIPGLRRRLLRRWAGQFRARAYHSGQVYEAEVQREPNSSEPGRTLEGDFKRED